MFVRIIPILAIFIAYLNSAYWFVESIRYIFVRKWPEFTETLASSKLYILYTGWEVKLRGLRSNYAIRVHNEPWKGEERRG